MEDGVNPAEGPQEGWKPAPPSALGDPSLQNAVRRWGDSLGHREAEGHNSK